MGDVADEYMGFDADISRRLIWLLDYYWKKNESNKGAEAVHNVLNSSLSIKSLKHLPESKIHDISSDSNRFEFVD